MVASVPESAPRMPRRKRRCRAHQFVPEPESAVSITPSGSRGLSSWKTLSGFSGSAATSASRASSSHHDSISPASCSCQPRSGLRWISGSSACSVSRASPARLTSIG